MILTSLFCRLFNHMLAHLFVLCLLLRPGMYSAIERPVMLPFLTLYTVMLVISICVQQNGTICDIECSIG